MDTPISEGLPALVIWTQRDVANLWSYLHNGNDSMDYVMGFRDKKTNLKAYKRSKKIAFNRGITWALQSAAGKKGADEALAFVPYSTNPRQESRWGALDFDAHDGNVERAKTWALAAFERVRLYDFAVILESSGSGGWHVWVIARDFKPASFWTQLLKGVAQEIGATIQDGFCEVFPPDNLTRGFGKGLRAPGCWNPETDQLSLIHWQNCDELLQVLPEFSPSIRRIGEVTRNYSGTSSIEKEMFLSSLPLSVWEGLVGGVRGCRIVAPSTRHHQLENLTGAMFHQVSRTIAEQIVHSQYRAKLVLTKANESQHVEDFISLWNGLEEMWLSSLSSAETEKFSSLLTDNERSAFRIFRSYQRKAMQDLSSDFPIVAENLGKRLGVTREGACYLRKKFTNLGIIELTRAYRPNVAAARFRWIADMVVPF